MNARDLQTLWDGRIKRAKKSKEEWEKQFHVELARLYFEGKQNPGYPENEWITINKIYSHLMAQLPSLYSLDPYFYVKVSKSYKPDPNAIAQMEQKATIRQSFLNYLKGELDLKSKARLGIQDAHFAFGVVKVHYTSDEVDNPDAGTVMKSDGGEDLTDEAGAPLTEPDTIPANEEYKITWVNSDDILFDEDAGPLEESWGWVAHHIKMTKDEAKNDKRLNKKALASMSTKVKDEDKSVFQDEQKSTDREIYEMYEIYDLKKKEMLIISCDSDMPLMKPSNVPEGVEDHPFAFLRFVMRDKSPYPIPPVSQAIEPQKEYCLARSRVLTHRKRFNRKYTMFEQAFADPDTAASQLENGDDGTVLRTNQQGQSVFPIADASLDQQNYLEIQGLNNDLIEIFGSSGESMALSTADSATQAGIIDKRMEIKEGDKLSIVTDWLSIIARKLDQLVQVHIDKDEAVRIVGPSGEFWQIVKATDYEDIEGEYEYSINIGSTTPRIPQIERAQWTAFMASVIVPMPQILTAPHFLKKMAEMYGIEDEAMLKELADLGQKMMSGAMPMPGGGAGSQAGVPENNPLAAILGAAAGPLGGTTNGGGAPGIS